MSPSTTPPRRFRPELVETSTKSSSRARDKQETEPSSTGAEGHASESHAREQKTQRFRATPIETTRSSNRNDDKKTLQEEEEEEVPDYGPLLPHERAVADPGQTKAPPARRKIAVEPVESSMRSVKKFPEQTQKPEKGDHGKETKGEEAQTTDTSKKPARRKFKVELIETAKRTHKTGDTSPALSLSDKTNASPGDTSKVPRPPRPAPAPANTPSVTMDSVPMAQLLKPLPNRQGSMHPHHNTRAPTRAHSFKVPELPCIESSESDRSGASSLPRSRSLSPASDGGIDKDATRRRESGDDRFSGYLLALAARAAEKQLRDQEAALFPSTDKHEPIMHYVDHEDSGDEDTASPSASRSIAVPSIHPTRRDSTDEKLALKEMQRHGEQRRKMDDTTSTTRTDAHKKTNAAFNVEFDADAQQDAWMPSSTRRNFVSGDRRDQDLRQMRKAASPPMLGGDIDFPRCPSPEHARFDVTQGSEFLRNSMCYLTNQGDAEGGLWGGGAGAGAGAQASPSQPRKQDPPKFLGIHARSTGKSGPPGAGLWGGHCNASDAKMASIPTGLMTPKRTPNREVDDPFSAFSPTSIGGGIATGGTTVAGARRQPLPPSPPVTNKDNINTSSPTTETQQLAFMSGAPSAEAAAAATARLEKEFPDSFVTQVYNYLSLGFPALARKYDAELGKISGMGVEVLRGDDERADHRGYLRLGEGEVGVGVASEASIDGRNESMRGEGNSHTTETNTHMCNRWLALRIYVREWGRQMGCGLEGESGDTARRRLDDPHRAWGVPARKGSWGN